MNVGCMIYHYGERFEKIGLCARQSFKKFHPDIPLHHIDEVKGSKFACALNAPECGGIFKYMLAYELMVRHAYDKMIILGGDTITCARLSEFLDNDEDILTTRCLNVDHLFPLYYKENNSCAIVQTRHRLVNGKKDYYNYNSDVVCFNNLDALKTVIEIALAHRKALSDYKMASSCANSLAEILKKPTFVGPTFHPDECRKWLHSFGNMPVSELKLVDYYADQAGLNIVANLCLSPAPRGDTPMFDFTIKCVDDPYGEDSVVYNNRSKGEVIPGRASAAADGYGIMHHKPWNSVKEFYVKDDKLYTKDHEQIKVWHYSDGFGGLDDRTFESLLDRWLSYWFNQETKDFFTNQCDCGDFFIEQGLEE